VRFAPDVHAGQRHLALEVGDDAAELGAAG